MVYLKQTILQDSFSKPPSNDKIYNLHTVASVWYFIRYFFQVLSNRIIGVHLTMDRLISFKMIRDKRTLYDALADRFCEITIILKPAGLNHDGSCHFLINLRQKLKSS